MEMKIRNFWQKLVATGMLAIGAFFIFGASSVRQMQLATPAIFFVSTGMFLFCSKANYITK